jgi:NAD(P)-dependent dehydrogenase (short-subunit alcohol dehydrogenase family)
MTTSVVTGGTGGIGRAVAADLTRRGHNVLTIGRSATASVPADLALMRDTDRAATELLRRTDRLDALVLCAGVFALRAEWTDEDLERSLALNYLSRFLLVQRLLPLLVAAPAGRIVLVANAGKYPDTLDLDDLQMRQGHGRGLRVAGRTQFANDLLAVSLAERLSDTRVKVSCVYPGPVATDVFRHARGVPAPLRGVAVVVQRLIGADPAEAARTPVWLADDPAASGGFYGPGMRRLAIPDRVLDPGRRAALWAASERILADGELFDGGVNMRPWTSERRTRSGSGWWPPSNGTPAPGA